MFLSASALIACSDDNEGNGNNANTGDLINFSINEMDVRTVYDTDDQYQINWLDGDNVRIFCAEANGGTDGHADYTVSRSIEDDKENYGSLKYNASGLRWGSTNTHNFYAVYPADGDKVSVSSSGIATFKINQNQVCTITDDADADGNYTADPDMTNAYMVASLSTTPIDDVTLHFKPIMTTLKVKVSGRKINEGSVNITGISVLKENVQSSDAETSTFQYDIASSTIVNNASSTSSTTSEITYCSVKHGTDSYIELEGGQSVTFTIFLPPLPINKDNQVKIRVHATGATVQQVTLFNNETESIKESSKALVTLPQYPSTTNGNNWITPLDDDIYVSQLSIPGTHDAATQNAGYVITAGRCQDLSIKEQLDMGIRAFDLRPTTTSANSSLLGGGVNADGNKNLPIYHGGTSCKTDMQEVFTTFNEFLTKNPKEFIIVTCRWEDEGSFGYTLLFGHLEASMNTFNTCMTNFLNNATYYPAARKVDFKRDLTIGEMRGKILIIMRPNQGTDPDAYYADEALSGTTFISGWPAGRDDVRTGIYFKSKYEGEATGYAIIQDYYHPESTTTKISLIKQELDMSAQSHTNNEYTNMWFINHCSGYLGSAISYKSYSNNASVTNPAIYEYITGTEKAVGSTGIMMLDFVGNRTANVSGVTVYGDLLPQAIIDNNYKFRMKRKGE